MLEKYGGFLASFKRWKCAESLRFYGWQEKRNRARNFSFLQMIKRRQQTTFMSKRIFAAILIPGLLLGGWRLDSITFVQLHPRALWGDGCRGCIVIIFVQIFLRWLGFILIGPSRDVHLIFKRAPPMMSSDKCTQKMSSVPWSLVKKPWY